MRILMAAPLLPHPASTAGGALVIFGELATLARRHDVTLVTFAGPSPSDRDGLEILRRLGVTVHHVWRSPAYGLAVLRRRARLAIRWASGSDPMRALKFRDAAMQATLDEAGRGSRFDIVLVEDSAMGQYRYPAGVPSVLTDNDVRAEGAEARRWHAYQRAVWHRFDRLQVYTERDAAGLRRLAPDLADRIRVNPFGVDLEPATDSTAERDGELVFVGGFHHAPNVDAACWLVEDIFPLVRAKSEPAHLTIVGADPPKAVRALASERVTVTGFVPDVAPYLERAAVVVAPLRRGSGMRVKLLQALARGKAIVTTPLGAEGLAPDPPLRVASSAPDIAADVTTLLDDAVVRHSLGVRARAFVAEHHSWSGFVDRLAAICRELGLEP